MFFFPNCEMFVHKGTSEHMHIFDNSWVPPSAQFLQQLIFPMQPDFSKLFKNVLYPLVDCSLVDSKIKPDYYMNICDVKVF